MLLESIAGAAIAAITPFLVKGGEAIATGVGKSLWKTIKKPFTSDKDKALIKELEKNPEDLKLQGKAEGKLEDLLADHPEIAEEISRLIPEAEKEAAILIQNSKNVVTAPINSGGGNVHIGDKN
ncbi:hypothetical protein MNBD_DELTA01-601 [hydrothermal vent metagenome]|uniref:Uncharacterized protein n=1 Tax=hydrothermal vent metagenome TaxID=652676 RepID=A0A3B0R7J5_9ZZZZ